MKIAFHTLALLSCFTSFCIAATAATTAELDVASSPDIVKSVEKDAKNTQLSEDLEYMTPSSYQPKEGEEFIDDDDEYEWASDTDLDEMKQAQQTGGLSKRGFSIMTAKGQRCWGMRWVKTWPFCKGCRKRVCAWKVTFYRKRNGEKIKFFNKFRP